jgi:hypothetical protein
MYCTVDGHRDQPQSSQSTLNQPRRQSDYSDSSLESLPLYSMYIKIAEEEDNKMVEYCQRDKDGTLIFVSPHVSP